MNIDNNFLNYNDSEKQQYILQKDENGNYILSEEQRIELLAYITSPSYIYKIVQTLSDKNKVSGQVLTKLDNSDIRDLLKTIDNIEYVIKGLEYLNDSYKHYVINQEKYDSKTRLNLVKYIIEGSNRLDVIKTIEDDTLLEESLKYFENERYKKNIIKKIKDETIKIRLAKTLLNDDYRYEILRTLDINTQIQNMDDFNLSNSNKMYIILSQDENQNYILSEEQRMELLTHITYANYIYKIVQTLSDKNKVSDQVLTKLDNSDIRDLLKTIGNIEYVIKGLEYLNDSHKHYVINQEKYDSKTRLSLVKYINEESNRLDVIKTIEDDTLLEESLKYFENESYKRTIIKKIKDETIKIRLAKTLQNEDYRCEIIQTLGINTQIQNMDDLNLSDIDKTYIILSQDENKNYIFSEDQRIELLTHITSSSYIYKIALTLSDKNKVSDQVLTKLDNSDIRDLLKTIDNIEYVIEGFEYLDDLNKYYVIKQEKYDFKTRLSLVKYISEESYIWYVIDTIEDDTLLEESLKYFENENYKINIIKKIKDETIKIRLAKTLQNEDYRYKILRTLGINTQIQNMDDFNLADVNKTYIILSQDENKNYILSEDQRIELLTHVTSSSYICRIALTLSDKNKVSDQILTKLDDYSYISCLLETIDNIEYVIKGFEYLHDSDKYRVINQKKYDFKTRLNLVKYINEESYIWYVIDTIEDDTLLEESLKYFKDETYKIKVIKKITNENTQLRLAEKTLEEIKNTYSVKSFIENFSNEIQKSLLIKLDNMLENEKRLLNITDNRTFDEEFAKIIEFGSKYRILTSSNKNIKDESRLLFLKDFSKERDRFDIISQMTLDDNKIKGYNLIPFQDKKNKMDFIRLLSDTNKIEQLSILDNNIDKLIIINEMKEITSQEEALKKVENYKNTFKELFENGNFKLISKFEDKILNTIFNNKQIQILHEYNKYKRDSIKEHFVKYIMEHYETLEETDISIIASLIFNIETSNSEELAKQADSFISSILYKDNPLETFKKTEQIFLQNHLPYFAKVYLTFITVHPDFESYYFDNSKNGTHVVTSPTLNKISLLHKKVLVLMDLIKCSLGSNSINFQEYLNRLEYGNQLYLQYKVGQLKELTEDDKRILEDFRDNLLTLNDNMIRKKTITTTGKLMEDISKLETIFSLENQTLADFIIGKYLHLIGINNIADARKYISEQKDQANQRNEELEHNNNYEIKKGDFIKSFKIDYFFNMFQNGVLAKDYLGADMDTDLTALDTDLSRIWKDPTGMSINDIIDLKNKDSGMFGQAYIVIKDNPNTINITNISNNEPESRINAVEKNQIFEDKLEAFSNGTSSNISNPYGIRTGFPTTKISFIVFDENGGMYEDNIYKLILPMVMNGLYIPIISKNRTDEKGKPVVLFTKQDYNELRKKMTGLTHYGVNNYKISENIDGEEYRNIAKKIDDSNKVIGYIKAEILNQMQQALGEEYNIITYINGNLEKQELQVLDTGSTSRSSNIPYDGDYDFVIRINRDIDINDNLKQQFINKLTSKFDIVSPGKSVNGDIKEMIIRINGKEYKIDLSFTRKTDKVSYSTEMCLQDRYETIKRDYPDKYKLVLANIIYAKKYLKSEENQCYKKGEYGQGGLGGVGVENWILQNGGSFYDAAIDFISNAYTKDGIQLDFEIFKKKYYIWDFGENFYTDRENNRYVKNKNLHDNFVNNMTKAGYQKMCNALKKYIENYNQYQSGMNTNLQEGKTR